MDINDQLNNISTIIHAEATGANTQGTGFFYSRLDPPQREGPQYRRINDMWVVTNRHVLLPRFADQEIPPNRIALHFRKVNEVNQLVWDPLSIETAAIHFLAKFHPDPSVDVALINIAEAFTTRVQNGPGYLPPYFLNSEKFAEKIGIEVSVSSDVLVVGYPRGFYDDVNLFPIVKSGIIASRWKTGFKGKPYFLIDAKLFPGSSGSVVITKPADFVIRNGQIFTSTEKHFAFLGIYSGEPRLQEQPVTIGDLTVTQSSGFDLGIVWYAELVEQIIDDGVSLDEALKQKALHQNP